VDGAEVIERAARAPALLLATDFDGTLAEITALPSGAVAAPGAIEALSRLIARPGVIVAVVSGRSLVDLQQRTAALSPIWRIAEHGSFIQPPGGEVRRATEVPAEILDGLASLASDVARRHPTMRVERKSFGVAVHFRGVPHAELPAVVDGLAPWVELARRNALAVLDGRQVVEARSAARDKGRALAEVLDALPAGTLPLFAGDDHTDEGAIATARARGGIGIYVASSERPRTGVPVDLVVHQPAAWIEILARIADRRRA
jgi:trehalose 6-phosphate phosphatase